MNKKFGLLRGLSDIMICEITDSAVGYAQVGTPEQLIPAGEMTISKSFEKSQKYYDNAMYAEVGREAPSDISLVGAAVRSAFLAWMEGKEIDTTTGAIMDDGDWHNKFYAISGKKDYTDGTSEYFWFLKCSFGGAEEAAKTQDDTTDASGSTLPFTAYSTIHKWNGKHRKVMRIDTADTTIKSNKNWNEQVVTPDNLADIVEAATTYTLTITQASGTTVSVTRGGSALQTGATLNAGDVLTISCTGGTIKVNDTNFTSGTTHTVAGNVTVVSTKSA